jgi:hypothetical protein
MLLNTITSGRSMLGISSRGIGDKKAIYVMRKIWNGRKFKKYLGFSHFEIINYELKTFDSVGWR